MALPIRTLPVVQNWDCHVSGACCKEYLVILSDEERRRIEAQGWDADADLGGLEPFMRRGWLPWKRRYALNHRADGSCVFLSEQGRCRIHERHGYETKPLACRLFPFVLVPTGDHWRVGLRFACPSAAANKGRPVAEHTPDLAVFANRLAEREGLAAKADGALVGPPFLCGNQRLDWPDTLRLVDTLTTTLSDRRDPIERRLRKCLAFAREMRQAKLAGISGPRLRDLTEVLRGVADAETPADPASLPKPGWVGRVLFRQAAALFTRKDHGPNRGPAMRGRLALLGAAWRFMRGTGEVPRMHRAIPEATFAQAEEPAGPLPDDAQELLERYYLIKVGSVQFCGAASFGLPFWEGLEALAVTYPVLLWAARLFRDRSRYDALLKVLTIVDDHVGFNRVLVSLRQRYSFRILARTRQLERLIAWYSR
jgi:lysine-N-methylase